MKKITHTPGPWVIMEPIDIYGVIRVGNGKSLQAERCADVYGTSKSQVTANARLIAAAPELLAALKNIVRHVVDLPTRADYDLALQAIAKVEESTK